MKTEIEIAVEFLAQFFKYSLNIQQYVQLKCLLRSKLLKKFQQHWNEQVPDVGSAYRAINVNEGVVDPIVLFATTNCGLSKETLQGLLPSEMVLWIDPGCVCYRVGGEHASILTIHMSESYKQASYHEYAKEMNINQFLKLALISA